MNIEEHIKFAIFSHTKTIKSLQDYVLFNKRFSDVVQEIDKGHNCEFGKWLDGPETLAYHQKTIFENVKRLHNLYHAEVARIVACIRNNDTNLAKIIFKEGDYKLTLSQFIQSLFYFLEQVKSDESYKELKRNQEIKKPPGKSK
jgi:hypothetical protein